MDVYKYGYFINIKLIFKLLIYFSVFGIINFAQFEEKLKEKKIMHILKLDHL